MRDRVILMVGLYDTLDIFTYELKKEFEKIGLEVMVSIPPELTAFQGFDAFFHAAEVVEDFVTIGSKEFLFRIDGDFRVCEVVDVRTFGFQFLVGNGCCE